MPHFISALVLVLALFIIPLTCSPKARAQGIAWDSRLDALGVTLSPAQDTSAGYWQLVSAEYLDEQQSAGLHHLYVKALDEQGNQLAGVEWHAYYPDGNVSLLTKYPPDFADYPLYDCFIPPERGGYSTYMGSDPAKSDTIHGLGLIYCHHVSFKMTWQRVAPCSACVPRGWLPMVGN